MLMKNMNHMKRIRMVYDFCNFLDDLPYFRRRGNPFSPKLLNFLDYQKHAQIRTGILLLVGSSMLILGGLISLVMHWQWHNAQNTRLMQQRDLIMHALQQQGRPAIDENLAQAWDQHQQNQLFINSLYTIATESNEDIVLDDFVQNKSGIVRIQGSAAKRESVLDFINALELAKTIQRARPTVLKRDARNHERFYFIVEIQL